MSRIAQEQLQAEIDARFDEAMDRCYKDGANPDDLRAVAEISGRSWHVPVIGDRYSRELFDFTF